MRQVCWKLILAAASITWLWIALFFVSTDLQMLELEEQIKLMQGKRFWEWHSPEGTFAMHYVEKGEGPNHILLLHGFRAHTYTWRFLIDPLAKAGYHVWAIDLIGFGLSDKPEHVPYNSDFFIDQLRAFMDAKGISKAHFVGNSMGGGLALNLAISDPLLVSSLSLLNALGYPHDLPWMVSVCRYIRQIWTPLLGPRMVRETMKSIVYDQRNITDEQVEAYSLPYRLPGGIMATLLTLQQFDNQKIVSMVKQYSSTQPMLVIWGEQDCQLPFNHFEKFITDFPNARKLLIPQCGHLPQEESPHEVLSTLLEFLKHP